MEQQCFPVYIYGSMPKSSCHIFRLTLTSITPSLNSQCLHKPCYKAINKQYQAVRCYIPIPQVNPISVSVCLVMFPQMQTVVHYLTKRMPPCSLQISLPIISHNNPSPSLPFTSARLMSTDFITTPLYHMCSAFSEQPCMELLPR